MTNAGGEPFPMAGVDFERPNAARMYDYMLGGAHNFAVDREKVADVSARRPDILRAARANRAFLGRAVRWCLDQGLDQFLDLGSGVPTVGNVHEIARERDPAARVAYVDFEPVAVAHAARILEDVPTATITHADLRDPARVLAAPPVVELLDLDRPVALLAVAVLHFVPDDLAAVLNAYRAALCPGSVLVLTHGSDDVDDPGLADQVRASTEGYRGSATEGVLRSRAELHALLDDLDVEVVAPGLVDLTDWPEADPQEAPVGMYAVAARLPPARGRGAVTS